MKQKKNSVGTFFVLYGRLFVAIGPSGASLWVSHSAGRKLRVLFAWIARLSHTKGRKRRQKADERLWCSYVPWKEGYRLYRRRNPASVPTDMKSNEWLHSVLGAIKSEFTMYRSNLETLGSWGQWLGEASSISDFSSLYGIKIIVRARSQLPTFYMYREPIGWPPTAPS